MRKIGVLVALALVLSIGHSLDISVNKEVIKCDEFGICDEIEITISNDIARQVYVKITNDDGLLEFGEYSKLTTNLFKSNEFLLPVMDLKVKLSPKVKPFSTGKYNISVYDATTHELLFILDPWWDTNWAHRKNITIDNSNNNATLINYAVKLNVSYLLGNMSANFADLRFTNLSDDSQYYWIENYVASSYADVWVNVSSILKETTTQISMYYGNPSATSESNGSRVFLVFDDAEEDHLSEWLWAGTGTSPKVERVNDGGNWILNTTSSGGNENDIYKDVIFKDNFTVEFKAYMVDTGQLGCQLQIPTGGVAQDVTGIHFELRFTDQDTYGYNYNTSTLFANPATTVSGNTWYKYTARYFTQNLTLWVDNVQKYTGQQDSTPTGYQGFGGYGSIQRWFDNITVRQTTTPEPTVSFGVAETQEPYVTGYTTPAYELLTYEFNISFQEPLYNYTNISITYDGVEFNATSENETFFSVNVSLPLIVNFGDLSNDFFWNYTQYNSTYGEATRTNNVTQALLYSYELDSGIIVPSSVVEGDDITAYLHISNNTRLGTKTVVIDDGTNHTALYIGYNNSLLNYSTTLTTDAIDEESVSLNYSWYLTITYGGKTAIRSARTSNFTIEQVRIVDCASGVPAVVYRAYDEETGIYLTDADFSLQVTAYNGDISRNYSESVTQKNNISICIPTSGNFSADVVLLYSTNNATNPYSQRAWYDFNITLDNATDNTNVYLINETDAFLVNIETRDEYSRIAGNVLIQFQRFNYSGNEYITMTKVLTTELGTGLTYLIQYDVPYKIILSNIDGTVLNTYDNFFVSSSTFILRTISELADIYKEFSDISHECSWDNSTKILSCTYSDPNANLDRVEFGVVEIFNYVRTMACNETLYTTSGVFSCDLSLSDNSSKGYEYYMYGYIAHSPDNFFPLETGTINKRSTTIFGASGLWIATLLFGFMFMIGLWKPIIAIILGVFSFWMSHLIGLIDLGIASGFILGTILIMALFGIWRTRQ